MYSEAVYGSDCVCCAILTHLSIFRLPTQAVVLCEKLCMGMKGVDDRVWRMTVWKKKLLFSPEFHPTFAVVFSGVCFTLDFCCSQRFVLPYLMAAQ